MLPIAREQGEDGSYVQGRSGWAAHKQQYKQQMYPGNATVDVIFHKNMAL